MRNAETVLGVLRERGKRRWPLERIYRLLYNPELYLLAYGRIYSNKGAMTPGVNGETADGMSMEKIERIIDALRHERYRFSPVKRVMIPKKSGKLRPLGLPGWSDKLVGEVMRLLLEAYYEPRFSDRSHGFRPERGCHTALREVVEEVLKDPEHLMLSGERREATVLFCDIRGFTTLSERLTPEQVVSLLNEFYTTAIETTWSTMVCGSSFSLIIS